MIVLIETLAGFAASFVGFLVTAMAVSLLPSSGMPFLGSDKTPAFLGIVLGGPLFCVGGFALVEGCTVGRKGMSILGLLSAFVIFATGMFLLVPHLTGNLQAVLSALLLTCLASLANRVIASRKKAPQAPADP